jgi:hypothetical protein
MAMMAKMRSLAPAFILTVGGLFVLFMVISDSNVLEALGGGGRLTILDLLMVRILRIRNFKLL